MFKIKPNSQVLTGVNTSYHTKFDLPIACPHCNAHVEPKVIDSKVLNYLNPPNLLIIVYRGTCCSKAFFGCYDFIDKDNTTLLTIYPSLKPATLPENIQELSPRFVNLYNQSYTAEQLNHIELAGSGYRNAMEVLIKDFAIKKLNKSTEDVAKNDLYHSIGEYLKEININTAAADVIRVLGNDYTHYQRKYNEIDFTIVKRYLEIFIKQIETNLLLEEPIIPVNRT